MKNRLLISTVTLSLAASVIAFTGAGAEAAPKTDSHRTAGPGSSSKAAAVSSGRPRPVQLPAAIARKPITAPAPSAADLTVIPKLDPSLNAAAGVAGATPDPSVDVAPNGTVSVIASGPNVAAAARSVGAIVGADLDGTATLHVSKDKLRQLAADPGVSSVTSPTPVVTQGTVSQTDQFSEGVASSGAQSWQDAGIGNGGTGVNIAIVDHGFDNLQSEIDAGRFGTATVDAPVDLSPSPHLCSNDSQHGTAVAEIAHQMAPNATLYLYCVDDNAEFLDAVQQIVQHNQQHPDQLIKIANSSIGFTGEARGDGYIGGPISGGKPQSTSELAVRIARANGILWVASAGNSAQSHWSGTFSDQYSFNASSGKLQRVPDNYLDFDVYLAGGKYLTMNDQDLGILESGASGSVKFTWDQWPTSGAGLELLVQPYQASGNGCSPDAPCLLPGNPPPYRAVHAPGSAPTLDLPISNSTQNEILYVIQVHYLVNSKNVATAPPPAVRYDLTLDGEFSLDFLSSIDASHAAQAAAGSISSPADSPFALAVGAAYVGRPAGSPGAGLGVPANSLETYSSRGPTIDGRVKPDLLGYDGTSSNLTDPSEGVVSTQYTNPTDGSDPQPIDGTQGFYGTSAAAPHVAGAAALVLAAHPSLDASQLEAFLEAPNNNSPTSTFAIPNNTYGHGLLQLGAADASKVTPAAGSRYHAVAPTQIVSTTTGWGVPKARMGAGTEYTVSVPAPVPTDATALVVGLLGTAPSGNTALSIYPSTFDGTATLSMSTAQPTLVVTSIVSLSNGTFKLRNSAAAVDAQIIMYGYFSNPSDGTGDGYQPVTPHRVLDTRDGTGVAKRKLAPNVAVSVNASTAGIPAGADVAVVNIVALNQTRAGFLSAYASSPIAPRTVNYNGTNRDNIALVPIVNNQFTLVNRVGTTDASVDVVGYFSPNSLQRYTALPSRVRLVNTSSGTAGRHALMTPGAVLSTFGGGLNQVPYNASALWLAVTAVGLQTGFLNVYPTGTTPPATVAMDYNAGNTVQNQAIAPMSAGGVGNPPALSTITRAGQIALYEDVYGYFAPPAS